MYADDATIFALSGEPKSGESDLNHVLTQPRFNSSSIYSLFKRVKVSVRRRLQREERLFRNAICPKSVPAAL